MNCSNCQKELAPSSNFCYYCGAKQTPAAMPGGGEPQPTSAARSKRLTRSVTDRKIAGVCGGLAEYFDLDAVIIRVVWLLLLFCAGTGLLAYIIMWIVVPLAPEHMTSPATATPAAR